VPESQVGDQSAVSFKVCFAQIIQEASSLPHHLQQAAPRVVVLLVLAEMPGQVVDASGEQRNLNASAPPIIFVQTVLLDYWLTVKRHVEPPEESVLVRK
jgi:hypothetical protein